jgi:hypothetical protein
MLLSGGLPYRRVGLSAGGLIGGWAYRRVGLSAALGCTVITSSTSMPGRHHHQLTRNQQNCIAQVRIRHPPDAIALHNTEGSTVDMSRQPATATRRLFYGEPFTAHLKAASAHHESFVELSNL